MPPRKKPRQLRLNLELNESLAKKRKHQTVQAAKSAKWFLEKINKRWGKIDDEKATEIAKSVAGIEARKGITGHKWKHKYFHRRRTELDYFKSNNIDLDDPKRRFDLKLGEVRNLSDREIDALILWEIEIIESRGIGRTGNNQRSFDLT